MPAGQSDACPRCPQPIFYHTFVVGIACPQDIPTHARGARNPFLPHIRCGHLMPAEHSDACPRCPQAIFYHTLAAGIACPQKIPTHARGACNPFLPHIRCGHRVRAEQSDACPRCPQPISYHTFVAGMACSRNIPTHARSAWSPFFTTHSLRASHAMAIRQET